MNKVIYISGPITGDPDYLKKFFAAEQYLTCKNWTVLNPAYLPGNMDPKKYMPICMAMLEAADAILLLHGFTHSDGSMLEYKYAEYQGKEMFGSLEAVPVLEGD